MRRCQFALVQPDMLHVRRSVRFPAGDQTRVVSMSVTLWSNGRLLVHAEHETGDCRNEDYIHTQLLLLGTNDAELLVLPEPQRPRHLQGGVESEDEEWRGGEDDQPRQARTTAQGGDGGPGSSSRLSTV